MKSRAIFGVVIGLGGLLGTAAVLLAGGGKKGASPAPQPAPSPQPGVPLTTDGRVIEVGLVSGIPTVRPFDDGPVNYDYNAPGWDYAMIGGQR